MRWRGVELRFSYWEIPPIRADIRADMWATPHEWKSAHSPLNLLSMCFWRTVRWNGRTLRQFTVLEKLS